MKRFTALVVFLCLMLVLGATANAALRAVAPPPTLLPSGLPAWYQDNNGLALGPCWDYNNFCTLVPPFCPLSLGLGCLATPINTDPAVAITAANFPIETFFFGATTVATFGPSKAKLTQVLALEGSFGGLPIVVTAGQQITFLRINVRAVGTAVPNSTYTVVHPYGSYTFTTDAAGTPVKIGGAGVNRAVDGCAASPCDFSLLLPAPTTNIGPWLVDTAGLQTAPGGGVYIGSGPIIGNTVTGSPFGTNFVSITGPCAAGGGAACLAAPVTSTIVDNVFFLSGKIVGLIASPTAVVFPTLKPGNVAGPTTVIVTNPTVTPMPLGPAVVSGVNSADFKIDPLTDTCSNNPGVPAAGTCTFNVTFSEPAPGLNGTKSAVISIPVNTLNNPPVIVNLSGAIDNIPPSLVSTQPANGDINVPANNVLTATFSELVTLVTETTFTVAPSGGAVITGTTVTFDAASKTATLTHPDLTPDASYTATIVGGPSGITDLAGNPLSQNFTISFKTTAPSTTPPSVVSTSPADNATGVLANGPITVTFNEAIQVNPLSVNQTNFFLSDGATGSVSYDPVTRTATLTPSPPLQFFHTYTATIKGGAGGVMSLGNIPMTADHTWKFVTNGAPSAPDLFSPEDGATGVALPVTFQWVKSKDVDQEPVSYHLWYCTNPSYFNCTPVDIASSATGTTASAGSSVHDTLAGLGGYGAGILLAGFAIVGGVRFKKKLFFFIAILAISGMTFAACSKTKTETVSKVPDPSTLLSKTVSDLKTKTTYYWKVVADDGNGALIESETRTFTTL